VIAMRNQDIATVVLGFWVCGSAVAAPAVVEESLGRIPEGARLNLRTKTTDFKRYAQVACVPAGCAVHVNGVSGPTFDSIVPNTLRFTAKGVVAYVGKRGDGSVMVVDNKEVLLPGAVDVPRFAINPGVSEDGQKAIAVTLSDAGKHVRVFDVAAGSYKDYGPYAEVYQPQFVADGRFVYEAKRDGQSFLVVDGVEGPHYEKVGLASISPNGKRFAYAVVSGDVSRYSIDGVLSDPIGVAPPVVFSADSKRYGYSSATPDSPTKYVVDGNVTLGPSGGTVSSPIVFSADGKHVGYVVVNDKDQQAYSIDGVVGPYFPKVLDLTFWSKDGQSKYAYIRVSAAGKPGVTYSKGRTPNFEPHTDEQALAWSADGKSFAYMGAVKSGKQVNLAAFVDGKRVTPVAYMAISPPVFASTGHQSAHIARAGEETFALIIDSKKRLAISGMPVTPVIATAEGFAFVVERNGERRRIEWRPK